MKKPRGDNVQKKKKQKRVSTAEELRQKERDSKMAQQRNNIKDDGVSEARGGTPAPNPGMGTGSGAAPVNSLYSGGVGGSGKNTTHMSGEAVARDMVIAWCANVATLNVGFSQLKSDEDAGEMSPGTQLERAASIAKTAARMASEGADELKRLSKTREAAEAARASSEAAAHFGMAKKTKAVPTAMSAVAGALRAVAEVERLLVGEGERESSKNNVGDEEMASSSEGSPSAGVEREHKSKGQKKRERKERALAEAAHINEIEKAAVAAAQRAEDDRQKGLETDVSLFQLAAAEAARKALALAKDIQAIDAQGKWAAVAMAEAKSAIASSVAAKQAKSVSLAEAAACAAADSLREVDMAARRCGLQVEGSEGTNGGIKEGVREGGGGGGSGGVGGSVDGNGKVAGNGGVGGSDRDPDLVPGSPPKSLTRSGAGGGKGWAAVAGGRSPSGLPAEVGLAVSRYAAGVVGEGFGGFTLDAGAHPGLSVHSRVRPGRMEDGGWDAEAWGDTRRVFVWCPPGVGEDEELLARVEGVLNNPGNEYVVVACRGFRALDLFTPQQAFEAERAFGRVLGPWGKILQHPRLRGVTSLRKKVTLFGLGEGGRVPTSTAVPVSVLVFGRAGAGVGGVTHTYKQLDPVACVLVDPPPVSNLVEDGYVANGGHREMGRVMDWLRVSKVDMMRGVTGWGDWQVRFAAGPEVVAQVRALGGVSVVPLKDYRMGEEETPFVLQGEGVAGLANRVGIGKWVPGGKDRIWCVVEKDKVRKVWDEVGKLREEGMAVRGWSIAGRELFRTGRVQAPCDIVVVGVPLFLSVPQVRKLLPGFPKEARSYAADNGEPLSYDFEVIGQIAEDLLAQWREALRNAVPSAVVRRNAPTNEESVGWDW